LRHRVKRSGGRIQYGCAQGTFVPELPYVTLMPPACGSAQKFGEKWGERIALLCSLINWLPR
jgi:hypothetical protein